MDFVHSRRRMRLGSSKLRLNAQRCSVLFLLKQARADRSSSNIWMSFGVVDTKRNFQNEFVLNEYVPKCGQPVKQQIASEPWY